MPDFDPTVPMGINPPAIGGNPMALAQGFAQTANELVTLQNARMTLAAKAKAGQIMASAPSLEDGVKALTQDPETSAFVPDIIATLQSVRASQLEVEGAQMTQANTGLNAILTSLLPAVNDPGSFRELVNARMQTLSPVARNAALRAMPSIEAGLFDGLPADPKEAGAVYQQRLAAVLVGAGMDQSSIRAATGILPPQAVTIKGPGGEDISMIVGGPMTGSPNAPQILGAGPTISQAGTMESENKQFNMDMESAAADAEIIPEMALKMDNIIGALKEFTAGGGADLRAGIGKGLQALKNIGMEGITDELIDSIANGSLSATQFFNASIKPYVINALKQVAQGTGNVMRPEVEAFIQMADATTDPVALMKLFNQNKTLLLQIGYARSQKFSEFAKLLKEGDPVAEHYGRGGFNQYFADETDMNKLPTKTKNGINLAPVPLDDIKGTSENKAKSEAGADTKSKLDLIFGGG